MSFLHILGSGSAINLARFPASQAIYYAPGKVLLLDTGSGAEILRQLELAGIPLTALTHIFISHTDFDHCNGLGPLLLARALQRAAPDESITVLGSEAVIQMLQTIIHFTARDALELWGTHLVWQPLIQEVWHQLTPELALLPFPAAHQCAEYQALGLIVEANQKRFCYSGDTCPHQALLRHATSVQFLIHDSTFLEEQQELAHRLGHSTAADAGRAAHAVGAEHLILTHINLNTSTDMEALLVAEAQHYFYGQITVAREFLSFPLT